MVAIKDLENFAVECIFDTRKRDSQYKPIPGTGDQVPCDCCGKTIEIHAHVYERKGNRKGIVGTQCCKRAKLTNGTYAATNSNYWTIKRQQQPGRSGRTGRGEEGETMAKMSREKTEQVASDLMAQRDDYERRGDATLRRQTEEELRVLLPRSLWQWAGVDRD